MTADLSMALAAAEANHATPTAKVGRMNTPDLDAIQARADAATEGPWMRRSDHAVVQVSHSTGEQLSAVVYGPAYGADAEFIANARTDVPALLAYARDLEARIGRVEAVAEKWRYKGEFGWGAWQEGHGPDPEGYALDQASSEIRAALTATDAS